MPFSRPETTPRSCLRALTNYCRSILVLFFFKCDAWFKITHGAHPCSLGRFSARWGSICPDGYPKFKRKEKKRKRRAQWLEQADVESRLSVCPLSDVKNNSSSTRALTTSCRFDHQTHQSLLRYQVAVFLSYPAHCFEDPTHLVENTPIWQMALVSNLCHSLSWHAVQKRRRINFHTWWIGALTLRWKRWHLGCLRNPSRRAASAEELWTFQAEVDAKKLGELYFCLFVLFFSEWTKILMTRESRRSLIIAF